MLEQITVKTIDSSHDYPYQFSDIIEAAEKFRFPAPIDTDSGISVECTEIEFEEYMTKLLTIGRI